MAITNAAFAGRIFGCMIAQSATTIGRKANKAWL